MNLKILVITGTVRENRLSRKIAEWYISEARKIRPEVDFEMLDIHDLALPLFNEPIAPEIASGQYSKIQQNLADKIASADGYVFVTAEYNYSVPGSLKNFLDYLSSREWSHKAAAYVGYGATGAIRAIEHLVQIMSRMRVMSIASTVNIDTVWQALDEQGAPKPEYIAGDVQEQLDELISWVQPLKAHREKTSMAI
ncbi:MAG TPA: NAD(P)H-dependent oxidoreductase [Candidatus Saccharimonadales bacterium]|nr:NAD(P)H-dependent oxidoreductase [Candidatus Saccharimonadales bacterium]